MGWHVTRGRKVAGTACKMPRAQAVRASASMCGCERLCLSLARPDGWTCWAGVCFPQLISGERDHEPASLPSASASSWRARPGTAQYQHKQPLPDHPKLVCHVPAQSRCVYLCHGPCAGCLVLAQRLEEWCGRQGTDTHPTQLAPPAPASIGAWTRFLPRAQPTYVRVAASRPSKGAHCS